MYCQIMQNRLMKILYFQCVHLRKKMVTSSNPVKLYELVSILMILIMRIVCIHVNLLSLFIFIFTIENDY